MIVISASDCDEPALYTSFLVFFNQNHCVTRLGQGLHTITAVPRWTQHFTLRKMSIKFIIIVINKVLFVVTLS